MKRSGIRRFVAVFLMAVALAVAPAATHEPAEAFSLLDLATTLAVEGAIASAAMVKVVEVVEKASDQSQAERIISFMVEAHAQAVIQHEYPCSKSTLTLLDIDDNLIATNTVEAPPGHCITDLTYSIQENGPSLTMTLVSMNFAPVP